MCDICTCGLHHCRCKPNVPFVGETTHRAMHYEMPLPQQAAKRPAEIVPTPFEPFEGMTTYQKEYIERPITRDPPREVVVEPSPPFGGESSYKREYTEKALPVFPVVENSPKPVQPFYDETSYRKHYPKKELPRQSTRQKSAPCTGRRTWEEPLEGMSTYKREYVERPIERDPPKEILVQPTTPFIGESSYKSEYTEKELQPAAAVVHNVKPAQPFYAETSYGQHYAEKPLTKMTPRLKSAPPSGRRTWEEPLEGMSTYKREYIKRSITREPAQKVVVEPPPPFEGASSYKLDYTEKELPLVPAAVHSKKPAQLFNGETSYRQHYPQKALPKHARREKSAPSTSRRTWEEPLEGMSTYKREYIERTIPREPRKEVVVEPSPPFVGESSYKRDFVEKTIPSPIPVVHRAKPAQAFNGDTSYRQHYSKKPLPKQGARPKSAPPTQQPWADPLQGTSTYKSEFVPLQLPSEQNSKYVNEPPPPLEGESSYKREFIAWPLTLETPRSPREKPAQPFHGDTSYREHYPAKFMPARRKSPNSARGNRNLGPGFWADPLGATSTYNSAYIKHPIEGPTAPPQPAPGGRDQRDWTTTSGSTYVSKELSVCPVTLMPPCPSTAPDDRKHVFWDKDSSKWR